MSEAHWSLNGKLIYNAPCVLHMLSLIKRHINLNWPFKVGLYTLIESDCLWVINYGLKWYLTGSGLSVARLATTYYVWSLM